MLKATLNILEKIMEKNYIKLTENDKISAKKIYENNNNDLNETNNENNKMEISENVIE